MKLETIKSTMVEAVAFVIADIVEKT